MNGTAIFDETRKRRYLLQRTWDAGPVVTWVMVNPSLAGELDDDPTIRRVISFSKAWGFSALSVVNLSPWVDPYNAPPGHDATNRGFIESAIVASAEVVVAWGTYGEHGSFFVPVRDVCALLDKPPSCLGVNANGSPKHPLYVSASTERKPWPGWTRFRVPEDKELAS